MAGPALKLYTVSFRTSSFCGRLEEKQIGEEIVWENRLSAAGEAFMSTRESPSSLKQQTWGEGDIALRAF